MKDFGYDVEDHRHVDPMFFDPLDGRMMRDEPFDDHLIEGGPRQRNSVSKSWLIVVLSHTSDQHQGHS